LVEDKYEKASEFYKMESLILAAL